MIPESENLQIYKNHPKDLCSFEDDIPFTVDSFSMFSVWNLGSFQCLILTVSVLLIEENKDSSLMKELKILYNHVTF